MNNLSPHPFLLFVIILTLTLSPWSLLAQDRINLCAKKTEKNDKYETSTVHNPGKAFCSTLTVISNPKSNYSASASASFPQHTGGFFSTQLSKCTNSWLSYRFRGWKNGKWHNLDPKKGPIHAKPTYDHPLPYAKKITSCVADTGTSQKVGYDKYEVHITAQDGNNNRANELVSVIRRKGPL